jgi:hypothetical protein
MRHHFSALLAHRAVNPPPSSSVRGGKNASARSFSARRRAIPTLAPPSRQ